jgi:hypothetical protein
MKYAKTRQTRIDLPIPLDREFYSHRETKTSRRIKHEIKEGQDEKTSSFFQWCSPSRQ